jgi:hypothetical protein
MAIGMCFGSNCGYAINPARDLGPRLFSAILYGSYVFTAADYFFWIPIVAPIVGAFLGGFLYLVLISAHLPDVEQERKVSNNRVSLLFNILSEILYIFRSQLLKQLLKKLKLKTISNFYMSSSSLPFS